MKPVRRSITTILLALALAGCATSYTELNLTSLAGGYGVKLLEGDVYRITFSGNGYTSTETAQTYWLNRCAQLAIEKGYPAFEILSNINLVMHYTPEEFFAGSSPIKKAQMIFVPMPTDVRKPFIEADIRLLKAPFSPAPPKVFDAAKLASALKPYVDGDKCSMGNVCEHVHRYLFPEGKL